MAPPALCSRKMRLRASPPVALQTYQVCRETDIKFLLESLTHSVPHDFLCGILMRTPLWLRQQSAHQESFYRQAALIHSSPCSTFIGVDKISSLRGKASGSCIWCIPISILEGIISNHIKYGIILEGIKKRPNFF